MKTRIILGHHFYHVLHYILGSTQVNHRNSFKLNPTQVVQSEQKDASMCFSKC